MNTANISPVAATDDISREWEIAAQPTDRFLGRFALAAAAVSAVVAAAVVQTGAYEALPQLFEILGGVAWA